MFKGTEVGTRLENVKPQEVESRSFDVGLLRESKKFWDALLDPSSESKDTIISKEKLDTENNPNLEYHGTISEGSLKESRDFWDTMYSNFKDNQDEKLSYKSAEKQLDNLTDVNDTSIDDSDNKVNELSDKEKAKIKVETGWSDIIINSIENVKQFEVYKNADLTETEINGRLCLVKTIDWNYVDPKTRMTNRERVANNLVPIDAKTSERIELHHMGQGFDKPLAELAENSEHGNGNHGILHRKFEDSWRNDLEQEKQFQREKYHHWKTRLEEVG